MATCKKIEHTLGRTGTATITQGESWDREASSELRAGSPRTRTAAEGREPGYGMLSIPA